MNILLNNQIIKKFNVIHHSAVPLYLAIKLLEVETDNKNFTKEEIASTAGVSEKTVQRYIKELIATGYVVEAKGCSTKGIKKSFQLNEAMVSISQFTKVSSLLVKDMLKNLIPSEMVVYIHILFELGGRDLTSKETSQTNLGFSVALSQQSISDITDSLNEKHYIRKQTVMGTQNRKQTTYILRKG